MATIKKKDLVDRIVASRKLKRTQVRDVVQDFLDAMVKELVSGNRIEFRGFGVFEVRSRAPRTAQNPRTGQRVPVPARNGVRFKAGRELREQIESGAQAAVKIPEIKVTVRAKRPGAAVA
jgi:nucleoid DNA-binding protein